MISVSTMRPFTRCLMTIGQLPTSYLVSMTYEEQLLWLCNYLEKEVIPALNNNAEALKEVQDLYVELKKYVDDYFSNLDVQEEINNKLDKMATDGTLNRIINQEIFSELNNRVDTLEENTKKFEGAVPKVHFVDRNGMYGDSTVIELENNNTIIDLGISTGLPNLITYLVEKNITTIKYLMISHWDVDHSSTFEGFKSLIENNLLDFSNCTFILPPLCNWSNTTGLEAQKQRCDEITNYLRTNNFVIKYPNEEEIVKLDDSNYFKFYNYNPSFIEQYESLMIDDAGLPNSYTQINNICGVMELNSFGKSFLFTGDIFETAENNIGNEIPNVDVLKISHHGLNRLVGDSFIRKIKPSYGVIMNGTETLPNRPFIHYYQENGGMIFTTNESGTTVFSLNEFGEITFTSEKGAYSPIHEIVIKPGEDLNDFTIAGTYLCNFTNNENPILNVPPKYTSLFYLEVKNVNTSNVYQTLYTLNNLNVIWKRKKLSTSSWTPWKRVLLGNPGFIVRYPSESQTISSDWTIINCNTTTRSDTFTDNLTLNEEGNIVIGANVNHVKVSANLTVTGNENDYVNLAIYQNEQIILRSDNTLNSNRAESLNLSTVLTVNENDVITARARNLTNSMTTNATNYQTNLLVEVID